MKHATTKSTDFSADKLLAALVGDEMGAADLVPEGPGRVMVPDRIIVPDLMVAEGLARVM
ncbi:hypothetical protein BG000_005193, partial [Podila horticola]